MTDTEQLLHQLLQKHLAPTHLVLVDDSDSHLGHPEANQGKHFQVTIATEKFAGLTQLQRHRLVYDTIGDFGKIALHALSIVTFTPKEFSQFNHSKSSYEQH